jgi:hypothetical protein
MPLVQLMPLMVQQLNKDELIFLGKIQVNPNESMYR